MSTFDGAGEGMPTFVPAPARIEASFGTLEFAGGGFADDATTRRLYDELDLQRATQAYLDCYPALSQTLARTIECGGHARPLGSGKHRIPENP